MSIQLQLLTFHKKIRNLWGRLRFRIKMLIVSAKELLADQYEDGIRVPGPLLRNRVHGASDRAGFLHVGKKCSESIHEALESIGSSMESFGTVLDFGCGCGRTLRYFKPYLSRKEFHGCDINAPLIRWCQEYIPNVTFQVSNPLPPSLYKSGQFDLVYLISILTHLDEDYQDRWLEELARISKRDGVVLISTHGKKSRGSLAPEQQAILHQKGFYFLKSYTESRRDGLPDFYQATFHTKKYIYEHWSKYFRIEAFIEQGMGGNQDLVILRNSK